MIKRVSSLFFLPFLLLIAAMGCSSTHLNNTTGNGNTGGNSTATLKSIAIAPANPTIAAKATAQLKATGTFSDGTTQDITSTVKWSSSKTSVATVNAAGTATGVAAGASSITATQSGVSASITLTVTVATVTVKSIAIAPTTANATVGKTQQFTANATYSDGSNGPLTSGVTWTSSDTAVATINSAGVATPVAAGTTTISASVQGFSAQAVLNVAAAPKTISTITVKPATATVAAGATQQFTATANYSDGSTASVTSTATWSSSKTSVATINKAGLATGVAAGTATVTAMANGISGSATLTVTASGTTGGPTVTGITITPASASFTTGSTQQFTATANYSDGTSQNVTTTTTWSSSNTSVATISASGLATGATAGSTTIQGSYNGTSATASATITGTATTGGSPGVANITTWHVDNDRSGLNPDEQVLTPANVRPSSFGKLFSCPVDGYVYGSPLILSNVSINGTSHNVLFVATEHDTVYAYDADNCGGGTPLWQVSLLRSGETPITNAPIKPYEGVTSTPVIDPNTGTLYVVSAQKSSSGATFRLNALDVTTGAQKLGGPVTINASVAATNSAAVNGVQTLDTSCVQRAALLLANGNVYIGFGGCHAGWLLSYSASSLQQAGVFNASPNLNGEGTYASAGGVWMGGAGPVADSSGNVYITTGNGPWDGQTAFSDSVLKFGPSPQAGPNGTMQPIDYFTPYTYQYMDCDDSDLAAGGLMMIPGSTKLIAGGKTGTMFLLDGSSLGHETNNDNGAIQEQVWGDGLASGGAYQSSCQDSTGTNYANVTSYEIFGTSAYFNGQVYLGVTPTSGSAPAGVREFGYSGNLTPGSDTSNYQQQGTRGTSPFISANGNSNGIVWMIDQGNPLQNSSGAAPSNATLRAYDAANFPTEIYDSNANAGDKPGYGIKFSSPVVANGKVYVSTGHDLTSVSNPQGEIDVYGLK